jgi:long-subunit fatty acid transport protein
VRLLLAALTLACALPARAYPLLPPRPFASAIAGPTDAHPTAAFYNPAALGPLLGVRLYLDGGVRLYEGSIDRTSGSSTKINHADPEGFVGLSWDLFGESPSTPKVTIALASFTPVFEISDYGPAVRYHEIAQKLAVLEQTFALAYRLSSRFYLGAGVNVAEAWLDYRFNRDIASVDGKPATEDPASAQEIDLRGSGVGIGFSLGILVRPVDRLWLALSYISHVYNKGRGGDLALYGSSTVTSAPADGPGDKFAGDSIVTINVPDMIFTAFRAELSARVDLEGQVRWIHYGERPQLAVSIGGGNLAGLGRHALPPDFKIDRGLHDTGTVELSTRVKIGSSARLAPSLVYETPAVEPDAVNAAAIDGHKLDLALTAEWRVATHFTLGAHVGGTAYIIRDVNSRFDANKEIDCVNSRLSLDACAGVTSGQGLPSASGRYTMFVFHAGAAVGIDY